MLTIFVTLTIAIFALIVLLLLRELGILAFLYEYTVTHPSIDSLIRIVGDASYGIGISLVGAVLFAIMTTIGTATVSTIVLTGLLGFGLIIGGAYLREN